MGLARADLGNNGLSVLPLSSLLNWSVQGKKTRKKPSGEQNMHEYQIKIWQTIGIKENVPYMQV